MRSGGDETETSQSARWWGACIVPGRVAWASFSLRWHKRFEL